MEVILYSNNCPQCKCLEKLLKDKKIVYQEINDVDLMISKGFKSMPMLEVDNVTMNYADSLKWVNKNNN